MSIVVQSIQNISVAQNADNDSINLFKQFDDPFTTGLVAQFKLYDSSLDGGVSRVVLFDQPGKGAPLTVRNFRNYVNDRDYKNTIIHRSVPDFVVQGGGFVVDGVEEAIAQGDPSKAVSTVRADDPVKNEFSPRRSNVRGTIAMAKLGDDPNSATNQWFFNLVNNSGNLDEQNGGFTVFGKVMSEKDFNPIEAIAQLPIFDARGVFNEGAFDSTPFIDPPQNAEDLKDSNFVRYRSITVDKVDELKFKITRNSNPDLVDARISGTGKLILDYGRNQSGRARITVQATNLLGEKARDTFRVRVQDGRARSLDEITGGALEGDDTVVGTAGDDDLKGRGGDDILEGGLGNDTITTGSGQDMIRLSPQDGMDVVTDFRDGRDRLQLPGSLSFSDLSITKQGAHTLILAGPSALVRLDNIDASSITQADISFLA